MDTLFFLFEHQYLKINFVICFITIYLKIFKNLKDLIEKQISLNITKIIMKNSAIQLIFTFIFIYLQKIMLYSFHFYKTLFIKFWVTNLYTIMRYF